VPDHPKVLARLLWSLPAGGVLAVQMPDNTNEPALMLMENVELKASTHVGPVVDRSQLDQDLRYIALGKEEGAKLH
jgi:trans-aconitate methyltransferase